LLQKKKKMCGNNKSSPDTKIGPRGRKRGTARKRKDKENSSAAGKGEKE